VQTVGQTSASTTNTKGRESSTTAVNAGRTVPAAAAGELTSEPLEQFSEELFHSQGNSNDDIDGEDDDDNNNRAEAENRGQDEHECDAAAEDLNRERSRKGAGSVTLHTIDERMEADPPHPEDQEEEEPVRVQSQQEEDYGDLAEYAQLNDDFEDIEDEAMVAAALAAEDMDDNGDDARQRAPAAGEDDDDDLPAVLPPSAPRHSADHADDGCAESCPGVISFVFAACLLTCVSFRHKQLGLHHG
jgi:hypothetical protein